MCDPKEKPPTGADGIGNQKVEHRVRPGSTQSIFHANQSPSFRPALENASTRGRVPRRPARNLSGTALATHRLIPVRLFLRTKMSVPVIITSPAICTDDPTDASH